ncbi:MAG: redoxin domain-containing protein [Vulcanimicrobiota bacterium]
MRWLICILLALAAPGWAQLRDLDGATHSVAGLAAGQKATVLVVWCSRCHSCRGVENDLAAFSRDGVRLFAVDPHPADDAQRVRSFLAEQGLSLEVLLDSDQSFLRQYQIDRTTTALVFDQTGKLRYFGPFQDYAAEAVDEVLGGQEVTVSTRPLQGCPIPRP